MTMEQYSHNRNIRRYVRKIAILAVFLWVVKSLFGTSLYGLRRRLAEHLLSGMDVEYKITKVEPASSNQIISIDDDDDQKVKAIQKKILDSFSVHNSTEKDSLINLHQFSFVIDSQFCKNLDPDIIIFIHSAITNFQKRLTIRRTWGQVSRVRGLTLAVVFMFGETVHREAQGRLLREAKEYGDMVQGNFLDTYHNLTYKHVMSLHWVLTRCRDVKMIVKLDDDVIFNVYNFVDYVYKHGFRKDFIYCAVARQMEPYRERSKWHVSRTTYPFNIYPDYCLGAFYLISPDVAWKLYKASEETLYFWVDDVYVTGLLTLKVGQELSPMEKGHGLIRNRLTPKRELGKFMALVGMRQWAMLWNYITKSTPEELKRL